MRSGKWAWIMRLGFLFAVLASIGLTTVVLASRWQALRQGRFIDAGDPDLSPAERLYLQTYISANSEELKQPIGQGSDPVTFVISPGETAETIASNLASAGLLANTELFIRYVRFYGLDSELEAGEFLVDPRLTIPELSQELTQAFAKEIELRFLEGWRMEEMADYLEAVSPASIDASAFQAIVQRRIPFDLSPYDFLTSLPPEASLEGFLFPDTYRVQLDADATYLVDGMLQNFGRRVSPAMRQSYGTLGLSLREAVTLASIVEREAVVAEERRLIAGVFYNRLAQGMRLEADATTQYALGYHAESGEWWKSPLTLTDLKLESPYNTYVVQGLPPGPISNPSLASLQAVAEPAETNHLFFVVDCTAPVPGSHSFSESYEEHLVKVERCRR